MDPAATRELRRRVLRPHLAPDAPLPGEDAPGALHLAAFDGDELLSTCIVYPEPCPWLPGREHAWHLRQMATAPRHRQRGAASTLLACAVRDVVPGHGGRLLWCNARVPAVPLYTRAGFVEHGEPFLEAETGLPHQRMWRELPAPSSTSNQ